jgi:pimeloyl-ACP methyl ester carboxylesterase
MESSVNAQFALIHSPLLGPSSWEPVAAELRRRGRVARVPELRDLEDAPPPYWQRAADSAAAALHVSDAPLLLVGHSGAGALLPAIAARAPQPVAGYIFVDAGLPLDGQSRLEEMEASAPEFAAALRDLDARGERFPNWTDEQLRPLIPDQRLRAQTLAELRPRPLAFFSEPIPRAAHWLSAPCGYLCFSPAYHSAAARARALGWPVHDLPGGHFHTLVDPAGVADALLRVSAAIEMHGADG